ncbi:MAG: FlgD immunoglobulin-like domain containing protein, partial [Candidatus Latescibacterota bacterium]|nr:FlgD immunoglobulin-like domain containing protein [Candidatus Latescibacterota bacterium]
LQVNTKRFASDAVGTVQRVSARPITGEQAPERLLIANGELFTGELPIPAELPTGRHRLHVELEDDRGQIYPFDQPYDLFPDRNLEIYSESLAEGWLRTGNVPRETTLFAGRQALTLPNRFTTTFQVRTPFDPTGYAALRFAFHPDAVEDFASNALAVTVDQHTLRLSFRGGDSLAVSLEDKRWQLVEIPLETLGLPGSNPPPVFRSVRISGNLRGTSHIADLALVAAAPPANTAVRETREDALPAIFTLAQNFPNPFNAATTIRFELPERADVELALYNLAGQRIATLATGERPAGTYTLTWDGRDDSGRALASGLYLYRLRSGQTTETRKLTLLR